ncbi:hypothetical protein ALC60_11818 [Trachymyrmex zeteki]|uniref:Uncharacterized protein n=1 Tax=Mycetomoellerius zeteki TaxID=64791 RepID=A0A151WMV6_9HYME|nr:hypothetical protein ALC60_11818 [Trachymyrmex zeteki]
MLFDDVKHKVRLSDETSVASAGNNDPIYILRKEIHDWRVSGQLTDRFERDCRLTEDETEKSSVQENCETVIKDLDPDPDVLHELPSSTAIDHSTRRTSATKWRERERERERANDWGQEQESEERTKNGGCEYSYYSSLVIPGLYRDNEFPVSSYVRQNRPNDRRLTSRSRAQHHVKKRREKGKTSRLAAVAPPRPHRRDHYIRTAYLAL